MFKSRKQRTINLMMTIIFLTGSAVVYAANEGGTANRPAAGDYTGSYNASGGGGANNADVKIDTNVSGYVYGGHNEGSGEANNNTVTMTGGTVGECVYGGYFADSNNNSNIMGNKVIVSGGKITRNIFSGYYSGIGNGNVFQNSVEISGNAEINGDIYAGQGNGDVNENSVKISGGTIGGIVTGGHSNEGSATGNIVTISDGTIGGAVTGGYSNSGNATGNTVTISGGTISNANVTGGDSTSGSANDNIVTISGGNITGNVIGGNSTSGSANDNILTISDGTITEHVIGGNSTSGSATGNILTISGGTIDENVIGGYSDSGSATGNILTISGGTINANVIGGNSTSGSATGNILTISGGTIDGDVTGGYSFRSSATGNTVTIKGNPVFGATTTLYGGNGDNATDKLTDNKLEVYRHTGSASGTHSVMGAENFAAMNFYLGNSTKNGDIMLQVRDEVKLDKTDIGVDIAAGERPNLVVGDKVTLIKSNASFSTTPKSQTAYAGIEKIYGLDFFKEDKALGVTVNKVKDNSKVQSLPVAQMTGQSMLRMGSDTISNQGMTAALTATKTEQVENPNDGEGGMPSLSTEKSFLNKGAVFATIGGGTSKYKASGTSDVNSFNIVTGMAWRINQPKNNNLLLGAFFEGGWGNYTTNNSFADGNVRGDGSSDYMGGGILGRYEFSGGTYVEGSVRMGRVKNDYHSDDLRGVGDARVGYNTSDSYTGAHIGLGYIKKINDKTELDLYGKYLYTHQGGSSVTVVGDNISFDPTNSHRLRLGARLAQKTTKEFNSYVGLAYEYEFDGKMSSNINYNPILAPSVKGSSGILELGVVFQPKDNKNLIVDLSINGYAGKREGVSGNLELKYLF